jgi:hypothetical protein
MWLTIAALCANADPVVIEPFKATYAVTYRGLRAGNIIFELVREENGQYVYRSTVEPTFLARMIISPHAKEMTRFVITQDAVQPLEWKLDDGESGSSKDGHVRFDLNSRRVQGTLEKKRVDFPLEPRIQDRLSVQIEVMRALLEGEQPGEIPLVDDERIKYYIYRQTKTERVKTPLGTFDTLVYESSRPSSKRLSRMWHAPTLGYVPVRAEQVRDGRMETIMQLVALEGRAASANR